MMLTSSLGFLHIPQANRPHVFTSSHHLGSSFRHVLNPFSHFSLAAFKAVPALESTSRNTLNRPIIEGDNIFEDEHSLLDLGEFRIILSKLP